MNVKKISKQKAERIMQMYPICTKKEICYVLEISRHLLDRFFEEHSLTTPITVLRQSYSNRNKKWSKRALTRPIAVPETKDEIDLRLSTERIKFGQHLQFLGFADLVELRRMYDEDYSLNDMAHELKTTTYHVLEGQEVIKMIDRVRAGKHQIDTTPPPPVYVEDDEPEEEKPVFVRPPAVYSNRSPYGIAAPGMG